MRLQISPQSPNVVVVTATINDAAESIVIDTATGTRPVPLDQWQADMGGTRPIKEPERRAGTDWQPA